MKNNIIRINTITDLHKSIQYASPTHPLVTVVDFSKLKNYSHEESRMTTGFYSVMLKEDVSTKIKYGREYYDFQEGTIVFIAPEQVAAFEANDVDTERKGWGLFFHPDLLRRTSLGQNMNDYSFFSYESHEALHLSDLERNTLTDIIQKIQLELSLNIDKHSQTLIVSNIELLLNYCNRYYDRQFITRSIIHKDVVSKFEHLLIAYFNSDLLEKNGLPTVKYCAEKMNLSPNYLSDLLKKETGKNTQEYIHYYLIEKAKTRLLNSSETVSQIAYDLGFEYPQYFSKIFKKKVGISPGEYRSLN